VSGTWSAIRAMPKSVILTRPSGVISRLPGLDVAVHEPGRVARLQAGGVCATMSSTRSVDSTRSRSRSELSASPGTSSMTR
jgi:hypothetical protein